MDFLGQSREARNRQFHRRILMRAAEELEPREVEVRVPRGTKPGESFTATVTVPATNQDVKHMISMRAPADGLSGKMIEVPPEVLATYGIPELCVTNWKKEDYDDYNLPKPTVSFYVRVPPNSIPKEMFALEGIVQGRHRKLTCERPWNSKPGDRILVWEQPYYVKVPPLTSKGDAFEGTILVRKTIPKHDRQVSVKCPWHASPGQSIKYKIPWEEEYKQRVYNKMQSRHRNLKLYHIK